MTKLKIQQLDSTKHLSPVEQEYVYGGKIAEDILSGYSSGESNINKSGSIVKFEDKNGNPSGALVSKNGSDYYIKDGSIEKVDSGKITASTNITGALL
jgi:hypothetical protein